jgi:chromosome segregation protein
MKLKSIKLAGFKTFVDPTKLALQSNLVAIVGPNGCGKSNIIDAIRWVMGESSAKQLRGEGVVDVIFNGSTTRKPVGLASIELIFDNSEGRLGGEYANYAEIAIRRQVNREGQSSYFLNGTRCRRRDVTDVFLGTGLGPRSYAIIEQGTISRLIEAKPEELRNHIEEAAGISKYKERRRETAQRMQHTRENLQRLNDVREEVGKQLERLEKQAQAANQFKILKEQERLLRASIIGRRWQSLDEELNHLQKTLQALEYQFEHVQAQLLSHETQLFAKQQAHFMSLEQVSLQERENYAKKNDISRIEQAIAHDKQRKAQLQTDIAHANAALARLLADKDADNEQIMRLEKLLHETAPELQQQQELMIEIETQLQTAEQTLQHWRGLLTQVLSQANQCQQDAQVQQTTIQHLERAAQANAQRQVRLQEEAAQFDFRKLQEQIDELEMQAAELLTQHESLLQEFSQLQDSIGKVKFASHQLQEQIQAAQESIQQSTAQLTSLHTIQQEVLGKKHNKAKDWLDCNGLLTAPAIIQELEVEPGWEKAIEMVLQQRLQAIGISDMQDLYAAVPSLQAGNISVFAACQNWVSEPVPHLLISKIKSPWAIGSLLQGIHTAASWQQAVDLLATLAADESVITPDGIWLSHHWLHIQYETDMQTGLLAREREIQNLTVAVEQAKAHAEQLALHSDTLQDQLQQQEMQKAVVQNQLDENKQKLAQVKAELQINQAQLQHKQRRSQEIAQDLAELAIQQAMEQTELATAKELLDKALGKTAILKQQQEEIQDAESHVLQDSQSLKQTLKNKQEQFLQLKNAWQTMTVQLEAKQEHKIRIQQQFAEQDKRCQQLQQQLLELEPSLVDKQAELQLCCNLQWETEQHLSQLKNALQECSHALQELEQIKQTCEQDLGKYREQLEALRIRQQTLIVKRQTLAEQLTEQQYNVAQIRELLAGPGEISAFETELEQVQRRIQRLGAINLAAIEEYQTQGERKHYLDAQYEDLNLALSTLQDAITKIDKETKSRFVQTFERVNAGLQELFPKLFGGGEAYLQLTDNNLLEAGVSIMARPPGKRNSTIHLLSGGEKALTAVALVFAIFQLNPAPFCLLDEVDAPLDEANVGRFSNLLKHMANTVQFLFITHNKSTMQTAEQLIGVTMREPGVSKLVAVDVGQALQLAEI